MDDEVIETIKFVAFIIENGKDTNILEHTITIDDRYFQNIMEYDLWKTYRNAKWLDLAKEYLD